MNKSDYHILTLKYLRGELFDSEKLEYEELLKRDPSLRRVYDILYSTQKAALQEEKKFLYNRFEEAEKRYHEKNTGIINISGRGILIGSVAAVVLVIVVVGFLVLNNTPTNNELFKQYYVSYTEVIDSRSGESDLDTLISALQEYRQKNYHIAIQQLKPLLHKPFTNIASFYIGLSYLELSDIDESINYLLQVSSSDNDYQQEAQWYLSLAYLKADRRKESKEVLKQILKNKDHYYFDKAERLQTELD